MGVVFATETFLPSMDGLGRMLTEVLAYWRYRPANEKDDRRRAGARALPRVRHDRAANVASDRRGTTSPSAVNRAFTAILLALTTR
jgi:hypothetical protein